MDLQPGEQLICEGHPSWRSILGFYLKGLALVVLAGAIAAAATRIANDEVDTAAGDDHDLEFGGVADLREVVEAVHRAQREADEPDTAAR